MTTRSCLARDAKLEELELVPIYISAHVKAIVERESLQKSKESSSGIWESE